MTLTAQEIAEWFIYDPSTGLLRHRNARPNGRSGGTIAGSLQSGGYRQVRYMGRAHYAHRVAWLLMTGDWPAEEIDHIDHDRSNNQWSNLRVVTRSENMQNQKPRSREGSKGIFFRADRGKWRARIRVNGRIKNLGQFETAEEAHAAYVKAAKEIHCDGTRGKDLSS